MDNLNDETPASIVLAATEAAALLAGHVLRPHEQRAVTPHALDSVPRPAALLVWLPRDSWIEVWTADPSLACIAVAEAPSRELAHLPVDDVAVGFVTREELLMRAQRALRRKWTPIASATSLPAVGDRTVSYRGVSVDLTREETALLRLLVAHLGGVVSREELRASIGNLDAGLRAIDTNIYRLRRKLERLDGLKVEGVRQRGYRLRLADRTHD